MPIKYCLIFLTIYTFLFVGCKTPEQPKSPLGPYAHMSQKERDSVAVEFNEYSHYFWQPTELHRLHKDTAILLNPKNVEYRQLLSYSYKKRGDHINAMKILNDAVDMDVKNGSKDALQYRAWSLLYYYRDYKGTIKDIDQILSMGKRRYSVCWGEPCGMLKGQALYKLGKYKEAILTLDTVLTEEVKLGFKAEDNYLTHFYLGRCYHALGQYDKAIESYQSVLKASANYTEALYQLGLVYTALNDQARAKEYLTKALDLVRKGLKMGEPYFERFDEVFEYQIVEALEKLK